jgi:hypothetical protein
MIIFFLFVSAWPHDITSFDCVQDLHSEESLHLSENRLLFIKTYVDFILQ